jgi:hypothetical protein
LDGELMQFNIRQSGLAVPASKPEPPPRRYGPLELQDADQRRTAKEALLLLWDAMGLSRPQSVLLPGKSREQFEAHYQAYRYIGEMLLGNDCPEKEQLT